MKCIICKKEFEPGSTDKNIANAFCEECSEIRDELTNGKEDDEE